jgi:hypothetical protein
MKPVRRAIFVATIACAYMAILATGQTLEAATPTINAAQLAKIEATARQIAAACGEPNVSMEVVNSTLGDALTAINPERTLPTITDPRTGLPWVESPVYVVSMHGNFVDADAKLPPGANVPSGTSLTVTIDEMSGLVVSTGVGPGTGPNMPALGAVTDIAG